MKILGGSSCELNYAFNIKLAASSVMEKEEATENNISDGSRCNWKCHQRWKQKQLKMTSVMEEEETENVMEEEEATEHDICYGSRSNQKWHQWWTKKQLKMRSVMEEQVCSSAFINVNFRILG